jgi:hypothetical protein
METGVIRWHHYLSCHALARSWLIRLIWSVPAMTTKRRISLVIGMTSTIAIGVTVWALGPRGSMTTEAAGTSTEAAATSAEAAQPVRQPASPIHPVQVERTLVLVTEEVVERPVRAARPRVRSRSETPLIARAKRVLFGSGRYRPEPFPRAERQESPAR